MYRLVREHLGVKHLRLIIGNSIGGMQTWIWGEKYPDFMDALVPMASQPTEMSSRNWMMRRLVIDSIKNDPEWNKGNYTKQPTCTSGIPRATTTRPLGWSEFRPRCWPSIRPTTNATRPRPASWSARSNA